MVKSLRACPCVEVQKAGCMAVHILAAGSTDCQKRLSAIGGIEVVVKAMEAHLSAIEVQTNGCLAISNLAAENAENQRSINSGGGIDAIIKAMHTHDAVEEVQAAACWALCNLATDEENQDKIGSLGGIATVTAAVARFSSSEVQERGSLTLAHLQEAAKRWQ